MSFDWYLDPATGDLPPQFLGVDGVDLIIQRARIRIQRHLGEVWEDKRAGLPYAKWAQSKLPDLDEVAAFMRREVQAVPGVLRTDGVSTSTVDGTVRTELTIVTPTDEGYRVRIDLLSRGPSADSGGAVEGSDPVPVPASPIVIIELIDPFIGL